MATTSISVRPDSDDGAQDVAANAAKAVDGNFHSHVRVSSLRSKSRAALRHGLGGDAEMAVKLGRRGRGAKARHADEGRRPAQDGVPALPDCSLDADARGRVPALPRGKRRAGRQTARTTGPRPRRRGCPRRPGGRQRPGRFPPRTRWRSASRRAVRHVAQHIGPARGQVVGRHASPQHRQVLARQRQQRRRAGRRHRAISQASAVSTASQGRITVRFGMARREAMVSTG